MLARPPVSRKPGRSARNHEDRPFILPEATKSIGEHPLECHYVLREIDQMRRCHSRWTTKGGQSDNMLCLPQSVRRLSALLVPFA